jgi:hypothetical protein
MGEKQITVKVERVYKKSKTGLRVSDLFAFAPRRATPNPNTKTGITMIVLNRLKDLKL